MRQYRVGWAKLFSLPIVFNEGNVAKEGLNRIGVNSVEGLGPITTSEDEIADLVLTPAGAAAQQTVSLGDFTGYVGNTR